MLLGDRCILCLSGVGDWVVLILDNELVTDRVTPPDRSSTEAAHLLVLLNTKIRSQERIHAPKAYTSLPIMLRDLCTSDGLSFL